MVVFAYSLPNPPGWLRQFRDASVTESFEAVQQINAAYVAHSALTLCT